MIMKPESSPLPGIRSARNSKKVTFIQLAYPIFFTKYSLQASWFRFRSLKRHLQSLFVPPFVPQKQTSSSSTPLSKCGLSFGEGLGVRWGWGIRFFFDTRNEYRLPRICTRGTRLPVLRILQGTPNIGYNPFTICQSSIVHLSHAFQWDRPSFIIMYQSSIPLQAVWFILDPISRRHPCKPSHQKPSDYLLPASPV